MSAAASAAREIEEAVIKILADALTSPASLVERFGAAGMASDQVRKLLSRAARVKAALGGSPGERAKLVHKLVEKIIVDEKTIIIRLRRGLLLGEDVASSASQAASDSAVELTATAALVTSVKLVEIREWSWGATTGGVASGKGGLRQGRDRRHGGLCCGRNFGIHAFDAAVDRVKRVRRRMGSAGDRWRSPPRLVRPSPRPAYSGVAAAIRRFARATPRRSAE